MGIADIAGAQAALADLLWYGTYQPASDAAEEPDWPVTVDVSLEYLLGLVCTVRQALPDNDARPQPPRTK